jgi:uncharacterized RDD family membrane protein YckC
MRCPKCQYISFGSARRCRNCGYDFSLSGESESLDLPIQDQREPLGPLADLPLTSQSAKAHADLRVSPNQNDGTAQPRSAAGIDLPLFPGVPEDAPLVTPPAVPRAPLSVRRATPPVVAKPSPRVALEDEPELGLGGPAGTRPRAAALRAASEPAAGTAGEQQLTPAPAFARIAAGLLDLLIMGSIDVSVVYLTLRLSGLQFDDVMVLPKVPLMAFLSMLNGGYLVLFTAAGGQTIGKMATGIRVVPQDSRSALTRVPFGTAVVRAAAYAASLLPAGLGFLPILFNPDGRTIHDRLSATRVVKA